MHAVYGTQSVSHMVGTYLLNASFVFFCSIQKTHTLVLQPQFSVMYDVVGKMDTVYEFPCEGVEMGRVRALNVSISLVIEDAR